MSNFDNAPVLVVAWSWFALFLRWWDDLNLGTSSTDDRVVVPFISRQGKHNKPRRRQALTRVCIVLTTLTNITAIFDRPRRIDYQALTKYVAP